MINFLLVVVLIILRNEYKTKIYSKNLEQLKKVNIAKEASLLVISKRTFFFLSIFFSWIYTSFLGLLIFVKVFGKEISDFDDIHLNCVALFSKEELTLEQAFIIYLLISNKEILYSSIKAQEYILEISKKTNFEISKNQIQEVFTVLGL